MERTNSWHNRYRGLLIRWEPKAANYRSMVYLACGLIAFQQAALVLGPAPSGDGRYAGSWPPSFNRSWWHPPNHRMTPYSTQVPACIAMRNLLCKQGVSAHLDHMRLL